MPDLLIACTLQDPPSGRLPPWGGLLDAAEEHGLWNYIPRAGGVHRLPEGVLWGCFADEAAALAALNGALEGASELLGYRVRAHRRLACAAGEGAQVEFSIAEPDALLYLPYQ